MCVKLLLHTTYAVPPVSVSAYAQSPLMLPPPPLLCAVKPAQCMVVETVKVKSREYVNVGIRETLPPKPDGAKTLSILGRFPVSFLPSLARCGAVRAASVCVCCVCRVEFVRAAPRGCLVRACAANFCGSAPLGCVCGPEGYMVEGASSDAPTLARAETRLNPRTGGERRKAKGERLHAGSQI